MALRLLTDSTVECVSLSEVKHHLRMSTASTAEDVNLTRAIKTARLVGQNICKRSFVPQTWRLTLDAFPSAEGITLPMGAPLSSSAADITITYVDSAGASQTLSSTGYSIDDRSEPGYLTPSSNNEWPDTNDQINAVTIDYVAGYPMSTDVVPVVTTPDPIKSWVLLRAGAIREYPEALVSQAQGNVFELPRSFVDGLLDPYVIVEV
jgi:uncharacterized phiE125 gp8 family phage protein